MSGVNRADSGLSLFKRQHRRASTPTPAGSSDRRLAISIIGCGTYGTSMKAWSILIQVGGVRGVELAGDECRLAKYIYRGDMKDADRKDNSFIGRTLGTL